MSSYATAALAEFHTVFPHPEDKAKRCALRRTLQCEEHQELEAALEELRLVRQSSQRTEVLKQVARELADVVFVCFGTANAFDVDLDAALREVHRANMAKVGGPTRADGKREKPDGWTPPDMTAAIGGAS